MTRSWSHGREKAVAPARRAKLDRIAAAIGKRGYELGAWRNGLYSSANGWTVTLAETPEARAFGQGAFAAATRIELLRSASLDPYRRTLGYFFLNGRSYSVLVIRARLAEETITRYGDNGLPREAAAVLEAAKRAGPLPFESHAWVEVDGRVVNDRPQYQRAFTVLDRL